MLQDRMLNTKGTFGEKNPELPMSELLMQVSGK